MTRFFGLLLLVGTMLVHRLVGGASIASHLESLSSTADQSETSSNANIPKSGGVTSNPGLLLTTADTIAFVYPKEMHYEHDYLNVIFKLNNTSRFRIEDSVYDNKSLSVYFSLSSISVSTTPLTTSSTVMPTLSLNSTDSSTATTTTTTDDSGGSSSSRSGGSGGSYLFRLRQHRRKQPVAQSQPNPNDEDMPEYELAPNWYLTRIYSNRTARLLSLDLYSDRYKRKLYWFEFNRATRRWSLGEMRFPNHVYAATSSQNNNNNNNNNNQNHNINYQNSNNIASKSSSIYHVTYHALNTPNLSDRHQPNQQQQFANDGYTYLAVASESVVFVSNNQSLILCHLENETCSDYFRPVTNSIQSSEDDYYDEIENSVPPIVNTDPTISASNSHQQQAQSTSSSEEASSSTSSYKFGKLMGIRYDAQENALYLNDFMLDKIEKLKFAGPSTSPGQQQQLLGKNSHHNSFRMASLEPILKSDYLSTAISHIAINPIASVEYDGYVYWADYEEGIRTSALKSTCFRSIYKVREPLALRLVHIPSMMASAVAAAGASTTPILVPDSLFSSPVRQILDGTNVDRVATGLVSLNVGNNLKYPPDFLSYFYNNYHLFANSSVGGVLAPESLKRLESSSSSSAISTTDLFYSIILFYSLMISTVVFLI